MHLDRKQKQISCLVLTFLLFFAYIWFSRPQAPSATLNLQDLDVNHQEPLQEYQDLEDFDAYESEAERNYKNLNIKLAREYQIDLSKSLWSSNRDQVLAEFMTWFERASNGVFKIAPEELKIEGYHRYSFTVAGAKDGYIPTIRLRDFSHGYRAGMTTVDLKYRSGETMMDMFARKGAPADQYWDTAVQKVEQDVHACDVRWSRGTRLFLDYSPTIETNADAAKLFPALLEIPGVKPTSEARKQNMDVFYWQASHRSALSNGLEYKITFTLSYKSIEDAFAGTVRPNKDGEFSVRLFAGNNGHSRAFREEDLKIVDDLFEELLWSDWNVDPDMECLLDEERDPNETEVWRLPIV